MKRQRATFLIVGIAIALVVAALVFFSREALTANNWHLPTKSLISRQAESMLTNLSSLYEMTFN